MKVMIARSDSDGFVTHVNSGHSWHRQGVENREICKYLRVFDEAAVATSISTQVLDCVRSGNSTSYLDRCRLNSGELFYTLTTIIPLTNGFVSVDIVLDDEIASRFFRDFQCDDIDDEPSAIGVIPKFDDIIQFYSDQRQSENVCGFGKILSRKIFSLLESDSAEIHRKLDAALNFISEIEPILATVQNGFKQVRGEPVNLRILAGKLENDGNALSTISQNYETMASEMQNLLLKLYEPQHGVLDVLKRACADLSYLSHVQSLLRNHYELLEPIVENDENSQLLSLERVLSLVQDNTCDVGAMSVAIPDTCRQLMRRINGLDVVKMLCRVESERMRSTDGGLSGIIDRLDAFHIAADKNLRELSSKSSEMMRVLKSISN